MVAMLPIIVTTWRVLENPLAMNARRVSPWELRELFGTLELLERRARNELLAVTQSERPAAESSGQPPGTMSRTEWWYTTDLNKVALVHFFVHPDGTIGGSGLPDPKRIWTGTEILFC